MRFACLLVVVGVGLAPAASSAVEGLLPPLLQGGPKPAVPCSDPRGCPDLLVDEHKLSSQWAVFQETYSEESCAVIEGSTQPGTRQVLRFTYNTPNLGPGDLVIGDPKQHPEWFEVATCHRHLHFKEYADYRLWTPEGWAEWSALRAAHPRALSGDLLDRNPDLQPVIGEKRGFCVIDVVPAPAYVDNPPPPKYVSCSSNQGISVGYADEYHFLLVGQFIDVTDVAPGDYVLEAEVNAERFFGETNYANNVASTLVTVPGHQGKSK